jgi:hypothetical protein
MIGIDITTNAMEWREDPNGRWAVRFSPLINVQRLALEAAARGRDGYCLVLCERPLMTGFRWAIFTSGTVTESGFTSSTLWGEPDLVDTGTVGLPAGITDLIALSDAFRRFEREALYAENIPATKPVAKPKVRDILRPPRRYLTL